MKYVNYEAYQEFESQFPEAAAFLLHHSLRGELVSLESRDKFNLLNEWERNRLEELRTLQKNWG